MKKYTLELSSILLAAALLFATAQVAKATTFTFSNTAPITINAFGPATPYPAIINVAGITSLIGDLNVVLTGFSHTFPSDVGVLLVGPAGQTVVLLDGVGGNTPVTNVNITLDDQTSASLPASGPIVSGTYKPTNFFPSDVFPSPAPGGPYGSLLSVFNGTNPNGMWRLFVNDFSPGDSGSISGGFGLQLTTVPEPAPLLLVGLGLFTVMIWLRVKEQ
jgi:subtilisin-like proprotein convertase family protein